MEDLNNLANSEKECGEKLWPPAGIKWYYSDSFTAIAHGDSLELLPQMPKVDLVLTDPDYNAKDIGPNHRRYVNGAPFLDVDDYGLFCKEWFELVSRLTSNIVFTPGIANTHNYPQPYWQICWHKPAAVSFNRVGGYNVWEPVFLYGKPMKRLGQDFVKCNTLNCKKGPESGHPCPKPLSLWRFLLEHTEGSVVDPFLGSGTTLVTAKQLNRKAIGIEIEEQYCEISARRLQQEVMDFRCKAEQENTEQDTGRNTGQQGSLTL